MKSASEIPSYRGKHVCIVYQYIAGNDASRVWYHRWGLNVMSYLGAGFEDLGLEVKYVDIETFINAPHDALAGIDYSLNLICGNIDIAYWAIVPSLSAWFGVRPLPNRAEAIVTGERKDTANLAAERCGLRCPSWDISPNRFPRDIDRIIIKPRDFGSSVGVQTLSRLDSDYTNSPDRFQIYQEFVEGVDVTVPAIFDPYLGRHVFGRAVAFVPVAEDYSWILDGAAKAVNRVGRNLLDIEKVYYSIPTELGDRICLLLNYIGGSSVARVDFRVSPVRGLTLETVPVDNYNFIEINPVPTMNDKSDFVGGIEAALRRKDEPISTLFRQISEASTNQISSSGMVAYSMLGFADATSSGNGQLETNQSGE